MPSFVLLLLIVSTWEAESYAYNSSPCITLSFVFTINDFFKGKMIMGMKVGTEMSGIKPEHKDHGPAGFE